jgi:NAD(P)-binding Rossmann-like domain
MIRKDYFFTSNKMSKKNIVIIGGGWAGIMSARVLTDYTDKFNIYLIEKEPTIGGVANSEFTDQCIIEYCWRVYFDEYYLVNQMLQDSNIFTDLCKVQDTILVDGISNKSFMEKLKMTYLEYMDYFQWPVGLRIKMMYVYMLPDFMLYPLYKNTIAYDYFDKDPFIAVLIGPILGFEIAKTNLYTFVKRIRDSKRIATKWQVSSHAPHRFIFPAILEFLQRKKVLVKTGTTVTKIENRIVYTSAGKIKADEIILACTLGTLDILPSHTPSLIIEKLQALKKYGSQNYLALNFYFSEPLGPDNNYILMNQPWFPIIETKRLSGWIDDIRQFCKPQIKEVWNVGVSDYLPSKNGKILYQCTLDQAIAETVEQVATDAFIKKLKTPTGKTFAQVFLRAEAHSFWLKKGKLQSKYPKFCPNVKTMDELLDYTYPEFDNFYFCGYYCMPTGQYGMAMETSAYTGVMTAQKLLQNYDLELPPVYKEIVEEKY